MLIYSADIKTEMNEITNAVTSEYSYPRVPIRGKNVKANDTMLIKAMLVITFLDRRM